MRTPQAIAIADAITARDNGAKNCCLDIRDDDMDALAQQLAGHTVGLTPADAMGEAIMVGVVAGWLLAGGPVAQPFQGDA